MFNLNDYQQQAHQTAVYPEQIALPYVVLGLAGEAGEVANVVKKILRGDVVLEADQMYVLRAEIGDCLWYLAELCTVLGLDFQDIATENLEKLQGRQMRGVLKGSGDRR